MKPVSLNLAECERETATSHAISVAEKHAANRGLRLSYVDIGDRVKTTECKITDSVGRIVKGRGKGISHQSRASAIYEALEHYYYDLEDKSSVLSSSEFRPFSEPNASILYRCSPDLRRLIQQEPAPLSCLRFIGFEKSESIDFPAILVDPRFRPESELEREFIIQSGIYRYSSNSGTASGLTANEAKLHGLLELVERDALGICFVQSVLASEARPLRRIDWESVPQAISELALRVQSDVGGCATVWDITTDVRISAALCCIQIGEFKFFGSGSSLSAEYAIERSLLEALQVFHIQSIWGPWLQKSTVEINRMTRFQRCCLDSGVFSYRGGEEIIEFSQMPNWPGVGSVADQISRVIELLKDCGISAFHRSIVSDEICVQQVIAPCLERLFLIMHGVPVAPSWRGKASIAPNWSR